MEATDRPLATVQRALAVLRVLVDSPDDLGNNEIARRTGINASTVSRLLATLGAEEVVRKMPGSGRYRLGPRLVELGNAALARIDLRSLARAHLVALTEATGETATLSVPGEHTVITVDFAQSPLSVRSVAEVGRPAVPHATATGKVFLAYGGKLQAGRLASCTRRTVTDRAVLAVEIARVRERGWAEAVGEREDDLNAVAAPLLTSVGELVGVLGLQGPAARFTARSRRAAVDLLLAHSAQIAAST